MRASSPRTRLLLQCLGAASVSALIVLLAEVFVAIASGGALLNALPPVERIRYLALVLVLFPALAIPAALLGFGGAMLRPRLGPVISFAAPALLTAEESFRQAGVGHGVAPFVLGGIATAVAVGLVALSLVRTVTIPPRATLIALIVAVISLPVLHSLPSGASDGEAEELAGPSASPRTFPPARNLLVLMVDTLRADHLGCYGYARPTSPRIDAFAGEGTLFENAATPKPKTSPAIASLFTGTWPQTHRVHAARAQLVEENVTLAETLQEAGFATFGVSANININKSLGFGQGFDDLRWVTRVALQNGERIDNHALALASHLMQWIERHRGERFFAYAHFIDPHSPYRPPPSYAEMFRGDELDGNLGITDQDAPGESYIDRLQRSVFLPEAGFDLDEYVARYDGEIRFTDEAIGAILDSLAQLGLAESTVVVLLSDHGESIVEHHAYFNHGLFPYEEQIHVPLILRGPGIAAAQRRAEQVSLVGLMPTLLDLMGVPAPEAVETGSYAGLLATGAPAEEGSATLLSAREEEPTMTWGLRTNRWKYLFNPGQRSPAEAFQLANLVWIGGGRPFTIAGLRNYQLEEELYDLQADPLELENLAYRKPARRATLRDRMESIRAASRPVRQEPRIFQSKDFSDEARRDLIKLGYMGR